MATPAETTMALIAQLLADGAEFCLATIVRTKNATSAKAGTKAVVLRDGTIRGFLGGGCVQRAARQAAAAALAEDRPRLIRVEPKDEVAVGVDRDGTELHRSACPSGGTVDLFLEPMRRAPRLILCGGSSVAVAVADLAARVGYRIAVAALEEDQKEFAAAEERLIGFDLAALAVAPGDWLVVATQGKRDREALAAALASPAEYVAFVGSRRKAEVLCAQLRQHGMADDRLARLKAPAGLDIHGIEPAEIAVSIIAEIVARRRGHVRQEAEAPTPRHAAERATV